MPAGVKRDPKVVQSVRPMFGLFGSGVSSQVKHGQALGVPAKRIAQKAVVPLKLATPGYDIPVEACLSETHQGDGQASVLEVIAEQVNFAKYLLERGGDKLEMLTRQLRHGQPLAKDAPWPQGCLGGGELFEAAEPRFTGAPGREQVTDDC